MILDKQNLFSDAQAVTVSAESTNTIDLGSPGKPVGGAAVLTGDMGKGMEIPLLIQVTTTFATLTSLKVAVQVATDEAFTTPIVVLESEAIAAASLVAGYRFNIDKVPVKTNERYMRLYYTVAGSAATAGKITAGIAAGLENNDSN